MQHAAEGRAREESFLVVPGLEIVAAVRPLPDKQAAWWFTPRLAASSSPQPVLNKVAIAASEISGLGTRMSNSARASAATTLARVPPSITPTFTVSPVA